MAKENRGNIIITTEKYWPESCILCPAVCYPYIPLFQVYSGYVDDIRNTDNSWMETVAMNFHDETGGSK